MSTTNAATPVAHRAFVVAVVVTGASAPAPAAVAPPRQKSWSPWGCIPPKRKTVAPARPPTPPYRPPNGVM